MPMHRAVAAYQNLSFTICLIPFVSSPVEVQPPGLCRSPGGGELLRRFSPLKAAKNIAQPCRIKPWRFAKLSKPAGAAEHSGTEYSSILQAEVSFGSSLGRCTQNPRFPGVTRAAVDAHAGADLLLRSGAPVCASIRCTLYGLRKCRVVFAFLPGRWWGLFLLCTLKRT